MYSIATRAIRLGHLTPKDLEDLISTFSQFTNSGMLTKEMAWYSFARLATCSLKDSPRQQSRPLTSHEDRLLQMAASQRVLRQVEYIQDEADESTPMQLYRTHTYTLSKPSNIYTKPAEY